METNNDVKFDVPEKENIQIEVFWTLCNVGILPQYNAALQARRPPQE
jgi:hypothetical protein